MLVPVPGKRSQSVRFVVSSEIFELFPGLNLPVAVAEGVDATADRTEVEKLWWQAWDEAPRVAPTFGNAQSHPRVAAWRKAMGVVGISGRKFPSSIEALLRRAFKGGEPPHINPLVDFYNAISLRHVVPAGGFDLTELKDTLELRLTREGDTFHPMDSSSPESVEPGEIAYAAGNEVLTRHFVWKQSYRGLLRESTSSVFLVCEVLGEVEESGGGVAEAILEDFSEGLRRHFGAEPTTFLVEERNPTASW
jgi:DNA/RNA-binding domain of Phe-tRNA-synthetase-like protein